MELLQAYELIRKSKDIAEVISIIRYLKNTYTDAEIKLLPLDPKDPLNNMYKLTVKLGKDGWYLPIGPVAYDTLKEVI